MVPLRVGDDAAGQTLLDSLQAQGVEVELRKERWGANHVNSTLTRLLQAQGQAQGQGLDSAAAEALGNDVDADMGGAGWDVTALDPLLIFDAYMKSADEKVGLTAPGPAAPAAPAAGAAGAWGGGTLVAAAVSEGRATLQRLLHAGETATHTHMHLSCTYMSATLQRLLHAGTGGGGDHALAAGAAAGGRVRHLQLDALSLSNFGPYGGPRVNYPLSNRGLVLIRGQVRKVAVPGNASRGAGGLTSRHANFDPFEQVRLCPRLDGSIGGVGGGC